MADDMTMDADPLPGAPSAKIIRAGEESAWRDGFQFLGETQRLQAAERAKGYAEGRDAGAKEASALLLETADNIALYMARIEPKLSQLAFDIVRRVLGTFDDGELVARAARAALAEFREASAVTIRVHPSAAQHVQDALLDIFAGDDAALAITIEADPRLDPRGCILATEVAVVDASIEAQLAAIAEAMKQPAPTGPKEPAA
jgi:type III secretion protein L